MLNQPRLLEPEGPAELGRLRRHPSSPPPLLRWVGSKLKTIGSIVRSTPSPLSRLVEPFVGSAIVFATIAPPAAILADTNVDLINFLKVLRDDPERLIQCLSMYDFSVEKYYQVRGIHGGSLAPVERAARFYFLNRYCWNGVYRLNKQGQFNVPVGKFKYVPPVFDRNVLYQYSGLLQNAAVRLQDYSRTISEATFGDMVYADPPYDAGPESGPTTSFVHYSVSEFPRDEQVRLADSLEAAARRGVHVIASNADTPFVREIYSRRGFRIQTCEVSREINSKFDRRSKGARELLITATV